MNLKIAKGKHYCDKFWPIFTTKNEIKGTFQFLNSAEYHIDLQKDTNKIVGLSDSYYHRRSSIRLGWRWNVNENKIEIMTIKYEKGKRTIESLCFIENDNSENCFHIKIYKGYYLITFNNTTRIIKRNVKWIPFRYVCLPYFGGDTKAPQDFNFKLIIS